MSLLKAEDLNKRYDSRLVVKGVSLEIHSGEIIGLLGRNGAGKTTIFQMIVGLIRPETGRIFLDGREISHRQTNERARAGLAYLPQEYSVFLKATVEDNLNLALELQPYSLQEREHIRVKFLEELGLLELARQPAHSLSGGERRRLEICRSLILKPKFLLLDEPFTGIDPLTIIELQKVLTNQKNKGIGVLLSDHNVQDTFKIADRVYIIDEGEILMEDTPIEVTKDERVRKRFLGKDFKFGGEKVL